MNTDWNFLEWLVTQGSLFENYSQTKNIPVFIRITGLGIYILL